jgi:hypothetical protein
VTTVIRHKLKRRSAIEPVIRHVKAEYRMGRNFLAGRDGDAANAILAAFDYYCRLLLARLAALLCLIMAALAQPNPDQSQPKSGLLAFFTVDCLHVRPGQALGPPQPQRHREHVAH